MTNPVTTPSVNSATAVAPVPLSPEIVTVVATV